MSLPDLQRLIRRATPRVEDVRSVDRTDFIRREHGHLPFGEVIPALDALEFSVDNFATQMQTAIETAEKVEEGGAAGARPETALHGLFRVVDGLSVFGMPQAGNQDGAEKPGKAWPQDHVAMAKQLIFNMLPDILRAWVRCVGTPPEEASDAAAKARGVLQLQVKGDLKDFGAPKWQLLQDRKPTAKGQIRYAFVTYEGYLANMAANLQTPVDGIGRVTLQGDTLKIAEVGAFLKSSTVEKEAVVHIDISAKGRDVALLYCIPCDHSLVPYIGKHSDPAPPKVDVQPVLQLQRSSGFAKVLPSYFGFQSFPGDLNFPVIDLARDVRSS